MPPIEDDLLPDRLRLSRKRRKRIYIKDVERIEKMRLALELKKRGLTETQIAKELGYYDASGVSKLIKAALRATIEMPADEVRKLQEEKLDLLWKAAWVGAQDPKHPQQAKLIEQCIKIEERRAALRGLDEPQKVAIDAQTRHETLVIDATSFDVREQYYDLLRQRPADGALPPIIEGNARERLPAPRETQDA